MVTLKIIEAFQAFKVDYLFSGPLAANLNGVLVDDPTIEVLLPQTLEQFKKVEKALLKLGFENTLPVGAEELFHFLESYQKQKNLKHWIFQNPKTKTERVLIRLGVDPSYFQPLTISLKGFSFRYLKFEDLKELGLKVESETPHVKNVESSFLLQRLENLRFYQQLEEKKELGKSKLISMKVPEPLLEAFKQKSQVLGVPYQTQIKVLMKDWLK
ncbi:MAG: CopG family antitoxin [Bdellovibrionales bacterium]